MVIREEQVGDCTIRYTEENDVQNIEFSKELIQIIAKLMIKNNIELDDATT